MSGQCFSEPGPSGDELQLKHQSINYKTRGSQPKEHQSSKEEIKEIRRQDKEATQGAKQTDQALPSIAATRMECKLVIHTWYSWGIATQVMLATGVQVQDASMLRDNSGPP